MPESVPTPLRTTEGSEDYAVVLNGEPLHAHDAGGLDDDAYVICNGRLDGERVRVWVMYSDDGMKGVTIRWGDDLSMELDRADEHPEAGSRYQGPCFGTEVTVEIVPGSEVDHA